MLFRSSRIKKFSDGTSWKGDDVVINAFDAMVIFWFFLASLSIALSNVELADPYNIYVSKLIFAFLVISFPMRQFQEPNDSYQYVQRQFDLE